MKIEVEGNRILWVSSERLEKRMLMVLEIAITLINRGFLRWDETLATAVVIVQWEVGEALLGNVAVVAMVTGRKQGQSLSSHCSDTMIK